MWRFNARWIVRRVKHSYILSSIYTQKRKYKFILISTYAPKYMYCICKDIIEITNFLDICIFNERFYLVLIMVLMDINIGQQAKIFVESRKVGQIDIESVVRKNKRDFAHALCKRRCFLAWCRNSRLRVRAAKNYYSYWNCIENFKRISLETKFRDIIAIIS